VKSRAKYSPLPALNNICLPLPPRGVRKQPARPSILNSAIDLPCLTRRKTAP
jgi:hypothetical protein